MKRDKRVWAGVLAAAVLWLVSVCAGSDDLSAAAEAVHQSGLARRLVQWELGGLFRAADSLSLPAALALEQSPQLARARYEIETAGREEPVESPQVLDAEDDPSPAPAAEKTPTQTGGDMARTLAVTTEDGYVRVGDVFIKNTSRQTVEDIAFDGTFAAKLGADAPQVLILHTHGSEAYTMPAGEEYEASGSYRTMDTTKNMIRVGDEIAAVLSRYGLSVLHDRQIHDTDYNSAYDKSYDSAAAYLEKYPSISFVLDIHRDAISDADGNQYKVVSQEDPRAAQLSIIMGSNYDAWLSNLRLAVAVQSHLAHDHPTLMRPITLRWYGYNQSLSTGSLLVEVGAAGNSLDEAIYAARLFARGFAETLGCTEPGNPSSPSA